MSIPPRDGRPLVILEGRRMKSSFINSRGIEVFCKPIAAEYTKSISDNIKAQYLEREEPIEAPVRWIPKMGGGVLPEKLTNFIDPTGTLLDGLDETEKESLLKHLDALRRMENDKLEALVNAYGLEGVELDHVPPLWIKRQKLIGNPLPTDEDELRLQYIKSEIIVTFPMGSGEGSEDTDFAQLSMTCQGLAFKGLTKEAEEQWRSRFRGRASKPENGNGNGPGGVEPAANGSVLVDEPDNVGSPDSQGPRAGAELV